MNPTTSPPVENCFRCHKPAEKPLIGESIGRGGEQDHLPLCLDCLELLLADGEAWVVDHAGQPAGFAVLRAFGRGTIVGPIVAPSEDEAIALAAANQETERNQCSASRAV